MSEYNPNRNCPCTPDSDWPECSTHGIVARGGSPEEQLQAVLDRDGYSDEDAYYEEGPTCPSCDGIVGENAITCPCGAVIKPEEFWVDPMPNATFEERMEMEVTLEREERMGW